MARYRIETIAALARQLAFAPVHARTLQLAEAERLLLELNGRKAYPYTFIVYRVTGYHPKGVGEEALLPGVALQHDLGVMVEELSDSLALATGDMPEPVLTIAEVCDRFSVTSKTIQRWRRKGLPARRFTFPDGKRRVGFLVSIVEQFIALHAEAAGTQADLGQMRAAEPAEILRHARRVAAGGATFDEVVRRVARKMRRSPLTVRHELKGADPALAERCVPPAGDDEASGWAQAWHRDHRLPRPAGRSRREVYRGIMDHRLARVMGRKQKFIDDALYHGNGARQAVESIVRAEELSAASGGAAERAPKDLPAYFQSLYRTPLLTPGRERAMFLLFNYHKFQFVTARRRLEPGFVRARQLARLERRLARATEAKNAIVAANLRLVVSVARKHVRPGVDLMDLISEGNITLMRAAESFDAHKGNKFSTYATLALMKGFARAVPALQAARSRSGRGEGALETVADRGPGIGRLVQRDHVRSLLARLEPDERDALRLAYGLESPGHRMAGERLPGGRALERRAIEKLKLLTLTP